MLIRKKPVNFGLDYARFSFDSEKYLRIFDHLFLGLSTNSNFTKIFLLEQCFESTFISNQNKDILILNFESTPVICIEKIKDGGIIKDTSYIFIFYGLFFRVPKFKPFFKRFCEKYSDVKVSRVDIALDLPIDINIFLKQGFETKYRKVTKFGENLKSGYVETIYFGAKGCVNKRNFIRVYDKLKDSEKKSKIEYFLEYFEYKNVTRVELQVNSISCIDYQISPEKLINNKFLLSVFFSCCYSKKTTYFNAFNNFSLDQDAIEKIYPKRTKSKTKILEATRHAKMMLAYAQTLYNMDFDVHLFLAENLESKESLNTGMS